MSKPPIGFIGLGVMGQPMALNLARAGTPLIVWNRSPERCLPVEKLGATVATDAGQVFAAANTIIVMLASEEAMDLVLQRGQVNFETLMRHKTVVHMGTTSPHYSQELAADIKKAGGFYCECPVSGSRKPAEAGQLVGMLAGAQEKAADLRSMLAPVCHQIFECGDVPSGLLMKLSVNLYLVTMVTGLCEAFHFALQNGLDTHLFQSIMDASPMASSVSRVKLPKLVDGDYSVQASIVDVLKNNQLIAEQARRVGVSSPLLDQCHVLYRETVALGYGGLDMAAVVKSIEGRADQVRPLGASPPDGKS